MISTSGRISVRTVLVFVTVLAPFTALRFSAIGIAELLIAVLFLYQVGRGMRAEFLRHFPLTKFWTFFIGISLVGAFMNVTLLSHPSGTWGGMAFDLSAYVFVLMTCFTFERLSADGGLNVQRFLRDVFLAASSVLSVLYFVSLFTPSLLGFSLRYESYFAPLTDNVHQVSMFLVPLPFLGVIVLKQVSTAVSRALVGGLIVMDAWMAFSTGSTKAAMAIVVGIFVFAYSYSLKAMGRRYFALINSAYLLMLIVLLASIDVVGMATLFFIQEDGAGARAYLYSNAVTSGMESFLVGRGPGPHVMSGYRLFSDAHQTFLTVFLQAGLLGLAALAMLAIRVGVKTMYNPALLAAFSAIGIYALGGDILRRVPIWILLFIVVHYPDVVPRRGWRLPAAPVHGEGRTVAGTV